MKAERDSPSSQDDERPKWIASKRQTHTPQHRQQTDRIVKLRLLWGDRQTLTRTRLPHLRQTQWKLQQMGTLLKDVSKREKNHERAQIPQKRKPDQRASTTQAQHCMTCGHKEMPRK